jgi:predicted MPP superfamily phosphohydrolase
MSDLKKKIKGWLRFLTKRQATAPRSGKAPAKDGPAPELPEQTAPQDSAPAPEATQQDSAPAPEAAQQDSAPAPEAMPQAPASEPSEQTPPASGGEKTGKRWGKKKKADGQPKVKFGKQRRNKTKRYPVPKRHWLVRLLIIALVAVGCKMLFDSLTDMSYFETTFYIIDDEKIENPMRIVLLSDLHLNEFGKDNIDLVTSIDNLHPDLIAIAGDMMNDDNPDDTVVITLCRQLVNIAPVYYAYGNHEGYVIRVMQTSDLNERLSALGVHVLHNDYETIDINGNIIDLGCLDAGVDYFYESYVTRFWTRYQKANNYHLLIVHYPNYFLKGAPLEYGNDVDLALCGHLHGGQVVIPGIGGLYHPSVGFLPDFASGVNYAGQAKVVVSRGLGSHGGLPRINNPPELVVVDVK